MADILIVVPALHRDKYSGGIICVIEYARGLVRKGHNVKLVPMLPSGSPRWIEGNVGELEVSSMGRRAGLVLRSLLAVARNSARGKERFLSELRKLTTSAALLRATAFPLEIQSALGIIYTREVLESLRPDITLATDYKTVLPVALYGSGRKFYFSQHYEPYFAIDNPNPRLAEHEARMSYLQGVQIVANSSWLKDHLQKRLGLSNIAICPNAINHEIFNGSVKEDDLGHAIKVISYGGRDAQWKGFKEMAQAMAIVRDRLRQREIRWQVYGSSILAPKNQYADFEPLGFLSLKRLAQANRDADISLSASWYESFPLFPIEAMACGLPIVTTQFGTEEYARDGETAQIVEPRDPQSIAAGLVKLIEDADYRRRLARNGWHEARRFTWESAVDRMERILLSGVKTPPPVFSLASSQGAMAANTSGEHNE